VADPAARPWGAPEPSFPPGIRNFERLPPDRRGSLPGPSPSTLTRRTNHMTASSGRRLLVSSKLPCWCPAPVIPKDTTREQYLGYTRSSPSIALKCTLAAEAWWRIVVEVLQRRGVARLNGSPRRRVAHGLLCVLRALLGLRAGGRGWRCRAVGLITQKLSLPGAPPCSRAAARLCPLVVSHTGRHPGRVRPGAAGP
jgi:hypothetical protein